MVTSASFLLVRPATPTLASRPTYQRQPLWWARKSDRSKLLMGREAAIATSQEAHYDRAMTRTSTDARAGRSL